MTENKKYPESDKERHIDVGNQIDKEDILLNKFFAVRKNYYLTFFGSPDLDLGDPGRSGRDMVAVRKPKHSL